MAKRSKTNLRTEDFRIRPAEPYKQVITPSSLYKANCPRCTWMSYWHNFSIPANLALQQQMSRIQEASFDGVASEKISPLLPKGWMTLHKGKITSQPLRVNGEISRWKLYGELDFLAANDDGTFSIIDGKVSMKKDPDELVANYWTQLEAYVYMLENPDSGEPKKIATIGLLQWRITGAHDVSNSTPGFKVEQTYIPVDRKPTEFQLFIEHFIKLIEGQFPDANNDCYDCKFLCEIGFY